MTLLLRHTLLHTPSSHPHHLKFRQLLQLGIVLFDLILQPLPQAHFGRSTPQLTRPLSQSHLQQKQLELLRELSP